MYRQARNKEKVQLVRLPSGRTAWAIIGAAECRAVLTSPHISSDLRHPSFPSLISNSGQPVGAASTVDFRPSISAMDPPEHTVTRRRVLGEFTHRRIKAMEPHIQQMVDTHVDAIITGPKPVDLVTALCLPIPSLTICQILGVPYSDHVFFQTRSAAMFDTNNEKQQRALAAGELVGYLSGLIVDKETHRTDDLIGRQVHNIGYTREFNRKALIELAITLLAAGHETTASMLSLGVTVLLNNPDQLAILQADPGKVPQAIEELLRYCSNVDPTAYRVATKDMTVAGVNIYQGDAIVVLGASANHDMPHAEEPGRFLIDRANQRHIAFGHGMHQCIGQHLARTEMRIAVETLLRRIPTLSLAVPTEDLPFKEKAAIYGLHALPVTW